ncbi:MAG: Gram-negative bacterial TonB protein C-terminal [Pseudomonadota bacterium]|jgi:TonB family protein
MNKKLIITLAASALATACAVVVAFKPCLIPSPICTAHLEKVGAQKDAENPYYLTFSTSWLAQEATILYPAYAMDNGLTGVAKLELRINADGKLIEKSIVESSGHVILDTAALAAADTFVFNVAGFGNVLFPYSKELKIRFQLDGDAGGSQKEKK